MTDGNKLREIIKNSGLKYDFICAKLHCTYATFRRKLNNENEFLASEIATLCNLFQLNDVQMSEIFFAQRDEPDSSLEKEG